MQKMKDTIDQGACPTRGYTLWIYDQSFIWEAYTYLLLICFGILWLKKKAAKRAC